MTLVFEPKTTTPETLSPSAADIFERQARIFLELTNAYPGPVDDDLIVEAFEADSLVPAPKRATFDEVVAGTAKTAWCSICERAVTPSHLEPSYESFMRSLPAARHAQRPTFWQRLRHAFAWKF
ncbi:hypothetical protein GMYAFLOJ_CDS0071 [Microbacterium phage phiMiGM15]